MSKKLKSLPKPVSKALDAYANFFIVQEYGSGPYVKKAETQWLSARKSLVRWLSRQRKRQVIYAGITNVQQ